MPTHGSFRFAAVTMLVFVCSLWAATSNPNATPEAKALLDYLVNLSGKKILSGQESMYSDGAFPSSRDKTVNQKTGKYPALYTSDFGDVGKTNLADRNKVVSNAISYHEKGSIVAFQYHMIQPDLVDGSGFAAMNIAGSGYTKVPDILTEGSALNKEFLKRLDELAGYFKKLEENNVAVLWRPFHEMNGDFFWWSFQERFKEFWIYEWKYLTNTKKCNNLLWVFGVNWYSKGSTGKATPQYYYPGHEYVDVLGCDFYTEYGHAYDQRVHDELRTLGGGKPIAIAENGTMPDLSAIRATQPYWVYWSTWWGFEGANKGNTDALYTKNYSDAAVITQDEVQIPNVSVLSPSHGEIARQDGLPVFFIGPSGLLAAHRSNGPAYLFGIDGKRMAAIRGKSAPVPCARFAPGAYIVREAGNPAFN